MFHCISHEEQVNKVKMDGIEIGHEGVDCTDLAKDRIQW
jgi:hypothetical protein